MEQLGLALYTLRNELEEDFKGTLEKVKAIGYSAVEFAGFGNNSATEIKAMLNDIGLEAWSSHVPLDQLRTNLDAVISFHKEVGIQFVVCPFVAEEERRNKTDYFNLAEELETIGHSLREAGLTLCYHNHDFEFDQFDDELGLDILLRNTRTCNMKLECDTFWVEFANHDAKAYVLKHENRVPIIHLKDMKKAEKTFAEVGEGRLDIAGIIKAAKEAGTTYFIVEQDVCERPPLESVEISYKNLQNI
ncbi:sugar phosphate isomerase/epimerase [Alkalihalobacillus xiaoxiensis]|uniref:Sugar phosphate isomerase/epimerase n=1 Tax=Shouchella xiaoxiensis TaxID=766895 RepID=A0ABS2ST18_9BACI|nr:sugar phosphate isomerase/epimerase [Shouchella xiaoxiensis]MBM7838648.1 sugar phosphate isomerase/epimerase [Shouchella xiaoxiensis]